MPAAPSICDVMPSAAAVLGVPGAVNRLSVDPGSAQRVVVLLVDGLGYHLLPRLAPHAPLLASVLGATSGRLAELACTFPSTTPTNLVSLCTGAQPGEHGVLGFTLRVPGTQRVLVQILWRDDPPPRVWAPLPTWFDRIAAHGLSCSVVLPAVFAGSGLTDAAYRGARFVGVPDGPDYAAQLAQVIRGAPGLTYGYLSALDTAMHLYGIDSPQWHAAAAEVDRVIARIVEALPASSVLLVTADHGGRNIGPDDRYDVDTDDRLGAGIDLVAGEPRVRYLHTLPGAVDDVVAVWRAVLGDRAQVLTRDEAIGSGLFGPVAPGHVERVGDVVVICTDDIAILATRREPSELGRLIGFHGGLTAAETAVPLITFTGAH